MSPLLSNRCNQTYIMREMDTDATEKITATSLDEAKQKLKEWAADADWCESEATVYVDYALLNDEGQTLYEHTYRTDPTPPSCVEDQEEHDFVATVEIEGGLVENPGVWGHQGGITISTHCVHDGCNIHKTVDTWADDGHGGHCETVQYRTVEEEEDDEN